VAAGSVTVFERFWSFIIVLCSACERQCYMIIWRIDMAPGHAYNTNNSGPANFNEVYYLKCNY